VIGVRKELALQKLLTHIPVKFQPAEGDVRLHALFVRCDAQSGRALAVKRISRCLDDLP